jgi:hypothetical protein
MHAQRFRRGCGFQYMRNLSRVLLETTAHVSLWVLGAP